MSQISAVVNKTIAMVSHHLQILKHQGIVQTEKRGRFVAYCLHPKVFVDSHSLDLGCCKLKLS